MYTHVSPVSAPLPRVCRPAFVRCPLLSAATPPPDSPKNNDRWQISPVLKVRGLQVEYVERGNHYYTGKNIDYIHMQPDLWMHSTVICTYPCHIQGWLGGILSLLTSFRSETSARLACNNKTYHRLHPSLISKVRGLYVEYAKRGNEYKEGHATVFYA